MKRDELLRKAAELGFRLFEPESRPDAARVLAEVARSGDPRLMEGFPVMLAAAAEKGGFDPAAARVGLGRGERAVFDELLLLSAACFRSAGEVPGWARELSKGFSREALKDRLARLEAGGALKVGGALLRAEKLLSNFLMYRRGGASSHKEALAEREELGLEYALSQVFSPGQKALFLKKLRHEKLSKTEREYFSRVVRKKAQALANEELHRLARRLFE